MSEQLSVPQSEALPSTSSGGASRHPSNEGGDMNHPDGNNYDANNSHHSPPEDVAAPWGSKPSATNVAYANHHHRAPPPPPHHAHGSYHPPRGHEPPHHHGGYHPPYGSSPHYPYHPPPPHDSHYPPPPPHHHAHYPPNNYNHPPPPPQMYHHHPGYYQHPPPSYYHHPPPPHYHPHHPGMSPHGPYPPPPPPHYSTAPPPPHDIVSPPNPHTRDNDDTLPSSDKPEHSMTTNVTNEQQQQQQCQRHSKCDMQPTTVVNMVTPSITTTATPGESVEATNSSTTIYTPEESALNQDDDSPTTTSANKELFTTTPHQMNDSIHDQQQQQEGSKLKGIGSTIFTKGLQPLQHTVPLSGDTVTSKTINNNATSNNSNSNTVTCSPHQLAQIKSLSHQAKLQIAKLKKSRKQVQQVESQRVADIAAQVDDENDGVGEDGEGEEGGGEETVGGEGASTATTNITTTTTTNNNNKATKKTIQKRYKDKDGFLYYRRVGTKHYKKLFEKGLVPKEYEGDEAVVERVNAIQMVSVGGGEEMGIVVHRPPMQQQQGGAGGGGGESLEGREKVQECRDDDNNGGGEVVLEEETKEQQVQEQQNLQLPPVHQQQTQMLYSHEEGTTTKAMTNTTTTASSDGYELRVVPHEDGNDFHVELIKPDQVQVEKKGESLNQEQQRDVGGVEESGCSLPFMENEGLDEDGDVEGGTKSDGSKKNAGEFDTAVDSILDAAETIAKRASPRSSPVDLPQSQPQPTEDSNHLPGISSLTKRKCEDMIQEFQQEKRQRSNSVVLFNPRVYPASNTSYPYPPPDTIRPSPPSHETSFATTGPLPQSNATAEPAPPLNNAYSQIIRQDRKEKRGRRTYCYPHPSVDLTKYYSSNRKVTKTKKEELTALALCAASHIQKEPVLFRAILLNMALEREKDSPKRHAGGAPTHLKNLALRRHSSQNSDESSSAADAAFLSAVESSGKKVIRDGFFWKDVPELEKVLQKHMMEYYYMSENRPQSKKQQQFNNRLVSLVYQEAIARGFVFDPASFSLEGHSPLHFPSTTTSIECAGNWVIPPGFNHKKLRDRIRCYYKTHVQNSKKRLGTLLKNPIKDRNRDILLRLVNDLKSQEQVELSPECAVALKRLKVEQDSITGTVSTPDGTSPDASSHSSDHSQQTTTTPYSSRVTISDGGSGSSTSTSHSLQHPHAVAQQPASTTFSPFKHASLLSSMRQLDSQRH